MRFMLRGARLVDATMDQAGGEITVDGAHIQQVGASKGRDTPGKVLDARRGHCHAWFY